MSEYDLVCDACGRPLEPRGAVVSWASHDGAESAFALTHPEHVPAEATQRVEARLLAAPNGYLRFLSDRLGKTVERPEALRAILWGLAPFVFRPDNPGEMDEMRAASFGARVGVKPGTSGEPAREPEGGK